MIKNSSRTESKVLFSKLCGDYYRYCSEVIHDKNIRVNYEKKCFEHYSYALKLAHAQLPPNHPQRLSISLNYSVCLYELLGDRKQACDLAKNAFDAAIQKLDELDEAAYKDATLIMQVRCAAQQNEREGDTEIGECGHCATVVVALHSPICRMECVAVCVYFLFPQLLRDNLTLWTSQEAHK